MDRHSDSLFVTWDRVLKDHNKLPAIEEDWGRMLKIMRQFGREVKEETDLVNVVEMPIVPNGGKMFSCNVGSSLYLKCLFWSFDVGVNSRRFSDLMRDWQWSMFGERLLLASRWKSFLMIRKHAWVNTVSSQEMMIVYITYLCFDLRWNLARVHI